VERYFPVHIPKWLYYHDKPRSSLTSMPTGDLDIERLAQSYPEHWRQEEGVPQKAKKKIILCSPIDGTSFFCRVKSRALRDQLELLLKEGFEIYIFYNDEIIPVTADKLFFLFSGLIKISVEPTAVLRKKLAQKGIMADQVALLDYFMLRQFLSETTDIIAKEEIFFIDFRDLTFENQQPQEALFFSSEKQPEGIIFPYSINADENITEISYFRARYPHLKVIQKTQEFVEEFVSCHLPDEIFFLNRLPRLRELSITGLRDYLPLLQQPKLEGLFLYAVTCHVSMGSFLKSIHISVPNLKALAICIKQDGFNRIAQHASDKDALNITFVSLRSLVLENIPILGKPLVDLLSAMPYLRTLRLITNKDILVLPHLQNDRLPRLEKLEYFVCNSIETLLFVLHLAPHLIKLQCLNLHEPILTELNYGTLLEKYPLPWLNELYEIDFSAKRKCPVAVLDSILCSAKHLRALSLNLSDPSAGSFHLNVDKWLQQVSTVHKDFVALKLAGNVTFSMMESFSMVLIKYGKFLKNIEINVSNSFSDNDQVEKILVALAEIKFDLPNLDSVKVIGSGFPHLLLVRIFQDIKNLKFIILPTSGISFFLSEPAYHHLMTRTRFIDDGSAFRSSLSSYCYQPTRGVDANTKPQFTPKEYRLDRIFYAHPDNEDKQDPLIAHYRMNVFPELDVKQDILTNDEPPFVLHTGALELIDCKQPIWVDSEGALMQSKSPNHSQYRFYGVYPMFLTNEWQPIPSFTPEDKLTHLSIPQMKSNAVEIKYNVKTNQYYIRSKNLITCEVKLQWIIEAPCRDKQLPLPEPVQSIVKRYRAFEVGELKLPSDKMTGEAYLDAIEAQKVGACRHRAVAFKAFMKKHYSEYPVNIASNDCHAYVEVLVDNHWLTGDLGGYPGKLNIDEDKAFKRTIAAVKENKKRRLSDINPQFITWQQKGAQETFELTAQAPKILSKQDQKILLEMSCDKIADYQLYFQAQCKKMNRPVIYLDSAKEIVCSAPWIERQGDEGVLKLGPGGKCHSFLLNNAGKRPVILVNWDNFGPNELVRFNSMLDAPRLMDGTPISKDALIIGFYDREKLDAYRGADFYSRFDERIAVPEKCIEQISPQKLNVIEEALPQAEDIIIDLKESMHWEQLLLGQWVLSGQQLHFKAGMLLVALKANRNFNIKNAPWHLPDFERFWQQFLIHKQIDVYGETLHLAPNVKITRSTGYDWAALKAHVGFVNHHDNLGQPVFSLNPTTFGHFMGTYQYSEHQLFAKPGWLAQHSGQTLQIVLTRGLSKAQWAQLLSTCQAYQVKLQVLAQAAQIPEALLTNKKDSALKPAPVVSSASVIVSEDLDLTAALLQGKYEKSICIDISECKPGDILYQLTGHLNENQTGFTFNASLSDIWDRLNAGKAVILKGSFSAELSDSLAMLCLLNAYFPPPFEKKEGFGQLILVTDSKGAFSYLECQYDDKDIEARKRTLLVSQYGEDLVKALENQGPTLFKTQGYTSLKSMLSYLQVHPNGNAADNWAGITHIPVVQRNPTAVLDLSIEASEQFEQDRMAQLKAAFNISPCVFIAGLTGVGKSTFIHGVLGKSAYHIYTGTKTLEAWAKDKSVGVKKVLFLDEVTLSKKQFSFLEGLEQKPPVILIENKLFELSEEHLVVAAGNPLSDASERQIPGYFERHGNAIVFSALSPAYLYQHVLKPVFAGWDDGLSEQISKIFLGLYEQICALSTDRVLITPRELQMMALMTRASQDDNRKAVAIEAAFAISRSALGNKHQAFLAAWYEAEKSFFIPDKKAKHHVVMGDILITPSRCEAVLLLEHLLAVQQFQQTKAKNDAQRYGGLGGIYLEGEPGVGKSELAKAFLRHHGFKEGKADKNYSLDDKIYYLIPATLPKKQRKALLLKAFDEGAWVICDEANSITGKEKLVNDLLMGIHKGERPKRAGFKMIETGNPIYFSGRKKQSTALEHRQMKVVFPSYPRDEMIAILVHKGLSSITATTLVDDYEAVVKHAEQQYLEPKPTFRDLLRVARSTLTKKHNDPILRESSSIKVANITEKLRPILGFSYKRQKGDLRHESVKTSASVCHRKIP